MAVCKQKLRIKINGKKEKELLKLLDKFRKHDGSYDCLVPGSGGKDSVYAAHLLKYRYKMILYSNLATNFIHRLWKKL